MFTKTWGCFRCHKPEFPLVKKYFVESTHTPIVVLGLLCEPCAAEEGSVALKYGEEFKSNLDTLNKLLEESDIWMKVSGKIIYEKEMANILMVLRNIVGDNHEYV